MKVGVIPLSMHNTSCEDAFDGTIGYIAKLPETLLPRWNLQAHRCPRIRQKPVPMYWILSICTDHRSLDYQPNRTAMS